MADIPDKTANVSISNDEETKLVTITTDGSKERLDVSALDINEDRSRLDQGQSFIVNMEYLLNAGQTKYQSIKTPNTAVRVYLSCVAYVNVFSGSILLYENPTGVVYDFSWTGKDRNRETANSAAALVRDVTSVTTPGTYLWKDSMYNSAVTRECVEAKLDQDTEYLIGMYNLAATQNLMTLQIRWYEI